MLGIMSLFINWYMLAFVVVLLLIAIALYFTVGPVKLLQIVFDARTLMLVIAVGAGITLYSSSQTIKHQAQTIQTQATQGSASADTGKVDTHEADVKSKHVAQVQKQANVIAAAPVGDKEDDLMDEIATEHANEPKLPDPTGTPIFSATSPAK